MKKYHNTRQILLNIMNWINQQDDIRASLMIRPPVHHVTYSHRADLNFVILSTNPGQYISRRNWLLDIGQHGVSSNWVSSIQAMGSVYPYQCCAIFDEEIRVDFNLFAIDYYKTVLEDQNIQKLIQQATVILVDKDHLIKTLLESQPKTQARTSTQFPTHEEFLNTVNYFLYRAIWTAKHLHRGEIWHSKQGCDDLLKILLFRIIEWHVEIIEEFQPELSLKKQHLERWADPYITTQLTDAFTKYQQANTWQILLTTVDLFNRIAGKIALKLGYTYPISSYTQMINWIKHCHSE